MTTFDAGVATSGFQIEGGYNGPGEPANNWARWERSGRVERSGAAVRFWDEPDALFERARAMGCASFRLSIEWARCEPVDGVVDDRAVERYRAILRSCAGHGLRPVVTLHHFTHPEWLGEDFWLSLGSPERFSRWAALAVDAFGDACADWVTVNEPNVLALQSYVTGFFPPGRRGATGHAIRALDNLLAAHALAYAVIRGAQPHASISVNTYAFTAYEIDRVLVDLLLATSRGIGRRGLHDHLEAQRADWHRRFPSRTVAERVLRHATKSAIPLEQAFPRALAAIAVGPDRPIDSVDVDFYDAVASRHLRLPGHRTAGGRNWQPARLLWDDPPDPAAFAAYCRAAAEPDLPLRVVENGLCNRVADGRSHARLDGWSRAAYLRAHLDQVRALREEGVPVAGYWHWTLVDNYEWGSYEPRFGIHGVDRSGDVPRIADLDAMGHDAASAFRAAIEGLAHA
ncbi:MAG TPA: family 1 glycosylhydrolase [Acidimicrobiales bacterium]